MTNLLVFSRRTSVLAVLAATALSARPAAAQATADARWQAFYGCWETPSPSIRVLGAATAPRPLRCVVPSDGGVDLVMVTDGKITERRHLVADGKEQKASRDGCTGVESAEFSKTGSVVYVRDSYSCANNVTSLAHGLYSFSPNGDWLDVESVTSGNNTTVRVLRFVVAENLNGVPDAITSALQARTIPVSAARTAARQLTNYDIIDASIRLPDGVVQAWLMERAVGYAIKVNAAMLTVLADQGVPPGTIDVLVALAYPQTFALDPNSRAAGARSAESAPAASLASGTRVLGYDAYGMPIYDLSELRRCMAYSMSYLSSMCDRFGYGAFGYSMYNSYGRYGYAGYGYGYPGYGYPSYGYPYNGGWYSSGGPVIVSVRPETPSTPGTVVNGRGYRQGTSSSGSTAPKSSATSGSTSGAASTGSSSTSGTSSTTSTGGDRTAHRKP